MTWLLIVLGAGAGWLLVLLLALALVKVGRYPAEQTEPTPGPPGE